MTAPTIMPNGKTASFLTRKGLSSFVENKNKYGDEDTLKIWGRFRKYNKESFDDLMKCKTEEDIEAHIAKYNLNV